MAGARVAGPDEVGAAGFRRVDMVQIRPGAGEPIATATGVLHRYPRTVRISVGTAARLAAAGVPWSLARRREADG